MLAPKPAPSRPAADFADFGLADAARCQARPPGHDSFLPSIRFPKPSNLKHDPYSYSFDSQQVSPEEWKGRRTTSKLQGQLVEPMTPLQEGPSQIFGDFGIANAALCQAS
jgi:hypothetical protein